MRQEIEDHIKLIDTNISKVVNAISMDNATLMGIVYVILRVVLYMLKRELKRLA